MKIVFLTQKHFPRDTFGKAKNELATPIKYWTYIAACLNHYPYICQLLITKMIYITRKLSFNAAHKLSRPDWDLEKNLAVYGKCASPNWHGHNYQLFVTVKGEVDPETGFLVDLKWLRDVVNERVVDKIDHKNLNLDVDFMKDQLTSTENLAIAVWNELVTPLSEGNAELHCIKIYETENNFVEYFG